MAALAADAALDAPRASMTAAPRFCTVGRKSFSSHLRSSTTSDAGRPPIADHQDEIAHLFSGDSVEAILDALEAADSDWARAQLAVLETKSPQTLKVAFRELQLGAQAATFAENMAMEYRIGARVVQRPDFIEGVRALIIDKDNAPRWSPATLEGVSETMLDAIFAPLPPAEEWTPLKEPSP